MISPQILAVCLHTSLGGRGHERIGVVRVLARTRVST
jgi:hypothetical protein